jgi:hypothetical protein
MAVDEEKRYAAEAFSAGADGGGEVVGHETTAGNVRIERAQN